MRWVKKQKQNKIVYRFYGLITCIYEKQTRAGLRINTESKVLRKTHHRHCSSYITKKKNKLKRQLRVALFLFVFPAKSRTRRQTNDGKHGLNQSHEQSQFDIEKKIISGLQTENPESNTHLI